MTTNYCTMSNILQQTEKTCNTTVVMTNDTCHTMYNHVSCIFQSFVIETKDEPSAAVAKSSTTNGNKNNSSNTGTTTKVTCMPACVRTPCGQTSAQLSLVVTQTQIRRKN